MMTPLGTRSHQVEHRQHNDDYSGGGGQREAHTRLLDHGLGDGGEPLAPRQLVWEQLLHTAGEQQRAIKGSGQSQRTRQTDTVVMGAAAAAANT